MALRRGINQSLASKTQHGPYFNLAEMLYAC